MSNSRGKDEKYRLPGQVDEPNDKSVNVVVKKGQNGLKLFLPASSGSALKTVYAIVPGDSGMIAGQVQIDIKGEKHISQADGVLFQIMVNGIGSKAIFATERLAFIQAKDRGVSGLKLGAQSFTILELKLSVEDLNSKPVYFGFKNLVSIKGYNYNEKRYQLNKKPTTSEILQEFKKEVVRYIVVPGRRMEADKRKEVFDLLENIKVDHKIFFADKGAAIESFLDSSKQDINDTTLLTVKVAYGDLLQSVIPLKDNDIMRMELTEGILKEEVVRYIVVPSQIITDADRQKFFDFLKKLTLDDKNFFVDKAGAIKAFESSFKGDIGDATVVTASVVYRDLLRAMIVLKENNIMQMELTDGQVVYDKEKPSPPKMGLK
jgi:hypothetical protein